MELQRDGRMGRWRQTNEKHCSAFTAKKKKKDRLRKFEQAQSERAWGEVPGGESKPKQLDDN
jgi:ferric-dicitrate binding protein FerR (iron transport regulator)